MQCNVKFVGRKSHKNLLKIKITEKLQVTLQAFLQVNTELQQIVFLT